MASILTILGSSTWMSAQLPEHSEAKHTRNPVNSKDDDDKLGECESLYSGCIKGWQWDARDELGC